MITLSNIFVVLVNPSHPGNIGASARAIMTMGLSNMILVNPDDFPSSVATARAAGAKSVLENTIVVNSFSEAIAGSSLVVGMSARRRTFTYPHLTPRNVTPLILKDAARGRVMLCFGREDSGLKNADLARCHYHIEIPANKEYPSLNLAAAIQIIAYELRVAVLRSVGVTGIEQNGQSIPRYDLNIPGCREWDEVPANPEEVDGLMEHFERATRHTGFLNPSNPMLGMARLRRLFNRARIDRVELNILRGILKSVEKLEG